MESDIRAKAPPGPSPAPGPGPLPEIPGRAKVESEGGWFGAPVHPGSRDLKLRKKDVDDLSQGGSGVLLPTFAPHGQLVEEIRHQVSTLAGGSHCNRKAMGRR